MCCFYCVITFVRLGRRYRWTFRIIKSFLQNIPTGLYRRTHVKFSKQRQIKYSWSILTYLGRICINVSNCQDSVWPLHDGVLNIIWQKKNYKFSFWKIFFSAKFWMTRIILMYLLAAPTDVVMPCEKSITYRVHNYCECKPS